MSQTRPTSPPRRLARASAKPWVGSSSVRARIAHSPAVRWLRGQRHGLDTLPPPAPCQVFKNGLAWTHHTRRAGAARAGRRRATAARRLAAGGMTIRAIARGARRGHGQALHKLPSGTPLPRLWRPGHQSQRGAVRRLHRLDVPPWRGRGPGRRSGPPSVTGRTSTGARRRTASGRPRAAARDAGRTSTRAGPAPPSCVTCTRAAQSVERRAARCRCGRAPAPLER